MRTGTFLELQNLCVMPDAKADTVQYLTDKLKQFLRPQDRVLFCFSVHGENSVEDLFLRAVKSVGAKVLTLNGDYRWINILKTAFNTRANVVLGPPLLILGLTKLAKVTNTPLYFRHVFTAGGPCLDWMIDGIRRGLDCLSWGCFDPGEGCLVAGFSCPQGRGIHIRDDWFDVRIEDDEGGLLPDGSDGNVVLLRNTEPQVRYPIRLRARKTGSGCSCGCPSPKLVDLMPPHSVDTELLALGQELYSWTSILDCVLRKGENGLEMELVVFPGEKLPKLPFCARQIIRYWNPDTDVPVTYRFPVENS